MKIDLFEERYRVFNQLSTNPHDTVDTHWKKIVKGKPHVSVGNNTQHIEECAKAWAFVSNFEVQDMEDHVALNALLEATGQRKPQWAASASSGNLRSQESLDFNDEMDQD